MNITLNPNIKLYQFQGSFAWNLYTECRVAPSPGEVAFQWEEEQEKVHKEFVLESIKEDACVGFSRKAFRAIGSDPARYRPSQEALMRRVLKNEPIPLVNTAVDIVNILSLRFRLPMGIYDVSAIKGDLQIKVGEPGDLYKALNYREVDGTGKFLLCDEDGPIGGPYVDSLRTGVKEGFLDLLHVVYLVPKSFPLDLLKSMRKYILEFVGGRAESYRLLVAE